MGSPDEIREFLTTRRAKLTPEHSGLPTYGRTRRVSGLRREEVALLAGISVEYYTRLERGNARGVSDDVLDAVSRALQLDEAEREHLLDLVRTANAERPPRRTPTPQRVRPSIQRIVDSMTGIPAFVHNGRFDILHANPLAAALYSGRRTRRGSCSSTRAPGLSTPTGRRPPTTSSRRSGARRVATPTTAPCRTSSGCCPRAARSSVSAGRATTFASTGRGPSASTTRWSGT